MVFLRGQFIIYRLQVRSLLPLQVRLLLTLQVQLLLALQQARFLLILLAISKARPELVARQS